MIAEHISLEYLPRILSNKPLLEHFLSVLLDKTVQLPCWPKEMPWDFCYPFADLYVRLRGKMLVSLSANLFDPKHLVDELRLSTGVSDPTCSIVISDTDIVGLGQSYCRIVPMAVGDSETRLMDSCWQIHILSFSRSITTRNAPSEIQQLLDHMAGMKIQPEPDSLLDRMLHEDFVWCWLNGARYSLKGSYSSKYEQYAQQYSSGWIDYIMEGYSQEFIKGYTEIDIHTGVLQRALDIAQSREELFAVCTAARIPEPMIQDAIAGKIWTQDDLLQWYETALAEEAERRRAAESENED